MSAVFSWIMAVPRFFAAQRNKFLELAEFAGKRSALQFEERIGSSVGFLAFDRTFSNLFDYALYPFVMYICYVRVGGVSGIVAGGIIMTILSFLICWIWIIIYDSLEIRLLILEDTKGAREYEGPSKWRSVIAWCLRKGDFLVFIAICLKFDPFYATVYMRKGDQHNGLKGKRDWFMFVSAVAVSNLVWWIPSFFIGTGGWLIVQEVLNNTFWVIANSFLLFAFLSCLWYFLVTNSKSKKVGGRS